jgi:hypothetical protein
MKKEKGGRKKEEGGRRKEEGEEPAVLLHPDSSIIFVFRSSASSQCRNSRAAQSKQSLYDV